MTTVFEVITADFIEDLNAARALVRAFSGPHQPPKVRIASANSATLLVAATFEEFIRELAREYAKSVVLTTESVDRLPRNLTRTAWKNTMGGLGRADFDELQNSGTDAFGIARVRFSAIYEFCKGDLTQDIYRDLIHNETNMRAKQLNELFKIAGLTDMCKRCADKEPLLDIFGESDAGKAHGKLLGALDEFIERRNEIAHSLGSSQSRSPEQLETDIDLLESLGKSLCATLVVEAPSPQMKA